MIPIPSFRINPVGWDGKFFTKVVPPEDTRVRMDIIGFGEQQVTLFLGIDEACHEIMEVYRAASDPNDLRHFYSWTQLESFYEDYEWLGDSELSNFDEE